MLGPKQKRERALGVSLGLKGERGMSPKSALTRKPYRPGVHGPKSRPRTLSEFGLQLREKSKVKLAYGLDERNLRRLFKVAKAEKGALGAKVVELMERRVDNVLFRLGFGPTRLSTRQLVIQGHIEVNGKKVVSPSYTVSVGDRVAVREVSKGKGAFAARKEFLKQYDVPVWLRLDADKLEGEILSLPADIELPFEINLLVESFSK